MKILLFIVLLVIIVCLILNPQTYINEAFNGVKVWATLLVPSLLPFFFFSKLFCSLNLVDEIAKLFNKFCNFFWNTSGISGYIFCMSMFSGYPVGSKITADLYSNGLLTLGETKKTVSFTSNSGTMFIVGTVGIGMLLSKTAGLVIFFSHIIGAFLNGIIYRNCFKNQTQKQNETKVKNENNNILNDCMYNSIISILMVGGFVVICFVIAKILSQTINITGIGGEIFSGIIEMTRGCIGIANINISIQLKTIICCGLISFGGISTMMQAMAFLKPIGISYKFFLLQKTTHAILSTLACVGLSFLFL